MDIVITSRLAGPRGQLTLSIDHVVLAKAGPEHGAVKETVVLTQGRDPQGKAHNRVHTLPANHITHIVVTHVPLFSSATQWPANQWLASSLDLSWGMRMLGFPHQRMKQVKIFTGIPTFFSTFAIIIMVLPEEPSHTTHCMGNTQEHKDRASNTHSENKYMIEIYKFSLMCIRLLQHNESFKPNLSTTLLKGYLG